MFSIPIVRDVILWCGGIDASRKCCDAALSDGKSLTIMVGGEREQILARRGHHVAYALKRKGFIRLACIHGVDIIPCYCFGEADLYSTSRLLHGWRMWLVKKFGIAMPLAWGPSWVLPLKPSQLPLNIVMGDPIVVNKSAGQEPTAAEVEKVHATYIDALRNLFEKHKSEHGCAHKTLEII